MPPLVSIIIPCYNAAPWLEDCLESAYNQTYKNTEIIFVDDNSTDESLNIAQGYGARSIKIIQGKGGNASSARNLGLKHASGEWIQFLDADDILAPDKISLQIKLASSKPEIRLISGAWTSFRENPQEANFDLEPNRKDMTGVDFLKMYLREGWMMQTGAWLTHHSIIEQCGPWNESLSLNDDGEFFARVMLKAGYIHYCSGAKIYYRDQHGASLSGAKSSSAMQSLFESSRKTMEYLEAAAPSKDTMCAIADGWRWLAFELWPWDSYRSYQAEKKSTEYGESSRRLPGARLFRCLSLFLGWRKAKSCELAIWKLRYRKGRGGKSLNLSKRNCAS